MIGNGMLSDYIADYDKKKNAAAAKAAADAAKAKGLAEMLASKIDCALQFAGKESEKDWLFSHPNSKERITLSALDTGKVAIGYGSATVQVESVDEGLKELARIVREG